MTTLHEVFEGLRILAEADTADAGTDKRRPSWAPALVLGDEILAALADLNCPLPDRKVARLWAAFANSNSVGRYLRVNVSTLPMEGVRIRAFELRLGADRSGTRLLLAKRGGSDLWSVETNAWSNFPHWREYHRAGKDYESAQDRVKSLSRWPLRTIGNVEFREHVRKQLPNAEAALVKCKQAYTELEAARADYRRRQDAFGDLIKQRVAEFAGDPFVQMISGAHVTGNCAICGRGLTYPISLERGIGPECFGHIARGLRAHLNRQAGAAAFTKTNIEIAVPPARRTVTSGHTAKSQESVK